MLDDHANGDGDNEDDNNNGSDVVNRSGTEENGIAFSNLMSTTCGKY